MGRAVPEGRYSQKRLGFGFVFGVGALTLGLHFLAELIVLLFQNKRRVAAWQPWCRCDVHTLEQRDVDNKLSRAYTSASSILCLGRT